MSNTNKKNIILVPVDFSEATDIAIHSAIELAKIFKSELILLNIFEETPVDEAARKLMQSQFVYRDIMKRLQSESERINKVENIKTSFLVKEGNIFDHIGKAAEEIGAYLMVMGTHGVKGVQHITGSYFGKVIHGTSIPVIVVQKKSNYKPIKNILLRLDLSKDTKAIENWAIHYAKYFNANLHLVMMDEFNNFPSLVEELTLPEIEASLKQNGITYTLKLLPVNDSDFVKHLLIHANYIDADLIMIEQKKDMDAFIIGRDEQAIILNQQQIPVFCINPLLNPSPVIF
ncbi:MAG: universal stress protein [Bacteroidota bacterium]